MTLEKVVEIYTHFLSGGLVYLGASAILATMLHWLLRGYLRACVWSVVTSVALVVILILALAGGVEEAGVYIIAFIFVPAFAVISVVMGLPFLLLRRYGVGRLQQETGSTANVMVPPSSDQ